MHSLAKFYPRLCLSRALSSAPKNKLAGAAVKIVEVGPRDGLQNEASLVDTSTKLELIHRLEAAGVSAIEATAFVSPKWVPQMADAARVMAGLRPKPGVCYPVLVPNLKGLQAALQADAKQVAVFAAASETFSQKNINCSIQDSLARFKDVIATAKQHAVKVRGYISCVVGCPYEGHVPPLATVRIAQQLLEMGCYEISLGDTIGVGTPGATRDLLKSVLQTIPAAQLALHCHDTYGQALANILVGLEQGIRVVDSSVAGLGGCPYARGASGNVATEDVVYMLQGLGLSTGIDLSRLVRTGHWISATLNRPNGSKVGQALAKL